MSKSSPIEAALLEPDEIAQLLKQPLSAVYRSQPAGGRSGELQGPTIGSGLDFADLRHYVPGDDPRHMDWRVSARVGSPFIRQFHQDLANPLCLLIDRSASMRFGTRSRLKAAQALRLAVRLAVGAVRDGRGVAALIIDSDPHWLPPQRGMAAIQAMLRQANLPCPPVAPESAPANWRLSLAVLLEQLTAGTELWLLSDFHTLDDSHQPLLRLLGQRTQALALCVWDRTEHDLTAKLPLQLHWGNRKQAFDGSERSITSVRRTADARKQTLQQRFHRSRIPVQWVLAETDDPQISR